jgi:hypothetical protein
VKPELAWILLVLLAFAQLLYVPFVAHGKGLGCGLWVLVTFLWMGVGYGLVAILLLPFFAEGRPPPWAVVLLAAYSFAPTIAVVFDPSRREDRAGERAGGWRRRIR